MPISEADKARFARQAAALTETENDDMGTPASRRRFVTWVNRLMKQADSDGPFIADEGERRTR